MLVIIGFHLYRMKCIQQRIGIYHLITKEFRCKLNRNINVYLIEYQLLFLRLISITKTFYKIIIPYKYRNRKGEKLPYL